MTVETSLPVGVAEETLVAADPDVAFGVGVYVKDVLGRNFLHLDDLGFFGVGRQGPQTSLWYADPDVVGAVAGDFFGAVL